MTTLRYVGKLLKIAAAGSLPSVIVGISHGAAVKSANLGARRQLQSRVEEKAPNRAGGESRRIYLI